MKYETKYITFHSTKCIWTFCLQNAGIIFGSDNGLSPVWCWAINWSNDNSFSVVPPMKCGTKYITLHSTKCIWTFCLQNSSILQTKCSNAFRTRMCQQKGIIMPNPDPEALWPRGMFLLAHYLSLLGLCLPGWVATRISTCIMMKSCGHCTNNYITNFQSCEICFQWHSIWFLHLELMYFYFCLRKVLANERGSLRKVIANERGCYTCTELCHWLAVMWLSLS